MLLVAGEQETIALTAMALARSRSGRGVDDWSDGRNFDRPFAYESRNR